MCAPAPPAAPPACAVDVVVTPLPHAPAEAAAPAALLTTFPIPWDDASPHDVAVAPDGSVWFTDMWHDCVGRFEPASGRMAGIALPVRGTQPHGLAITADGTVWYASPGRSVIGRIDGGNHDLREYALTEPPLAPHSLVVHDGLVWFTGGLAGHFGVLDPATGYTELYALPLDGAVPYDIAVAADGGIWVTLTGASALARIDPATRTARLVPLPDGAAASGVAAGADRRIWYTDTGRSRVSVLSAAAAAAAGDAPAGRAAGAAADPVPADTGATAVAAAAGAAPIAAAAQSGAEPAVREHPTAQPNAHPRSPVVAPDGRVWYFEEAFARLAVLHEGGAAAALELPELPEPGRVVRRIAVDARRAALWVGPGGSGALVRVDLAPVR